MYALEGLVATFLEDSELGDWLRENVELTVVPFVDMDGAVEGDQGKWRLPHDHNRDYTEFLYPETAALASLIAETEPQMFLDFHNPKLYKYNDNYIYTPYKGWSATWPPTCGTSHPSGTTFRTTRRWPSHRRRMPSC